MRILIRASQSPFDNLSPYNTFLYDKIWSNVGNLLFPYSIYRNLLSDNTTIEPYAKRPNTADADFINNNYDVFLLPFANAFRSNFEEKLSLWTDLINAVKIPCIIVGIGVQSDLNYSEESKFSFDEPAINFCKAVAKKSAYIGVRGEITYNYLKRLGFGEITQIIGCPSMYMFGENLPAPKEKITGKLSISVNGKNTDDNLIKKFLFSDNSFSFYIPQKTDELKLLYCENTVIAPSKENIYPISIGNRLFTDDKIQFCVNVPSWLDLLKTVDFSIGTRIHGSIAAVLAGIPTFILATDTRMMELAKYHNIPYIETSNFDFSKMFRDLYEETDFTTVNKGHKERYENFVKFLRENGLDPVRQPNVVFDKKIEETQFYPPVHSILTVPREEAAKRLNEYYGYLNKKIEKLRKDNIALKKENADLRKNKNELDILKGMASEISNIVEKYKV